MERGGNLLREVRFTGRRNFRVGTYCCAELKSHGEHARYLKCTGKSRESV